MNTKFSYLYRDGSNYKSFNEVIISGSLTLANIVLYLYEQNLFIPSEIGLPDLQEPFISIEDHIWHEIDSVSPTFDEPTIELDAKTLIMRFRTARRKNWNQCQVLRRKGYI